MHIVHAESAASNVNRSALSRALLGHKGMEVKFSPSRTTLASSTWKGGQGEGDGIVFILPTKLVTPVEDEETLQTAMEVFDEDQEERAPVGGEQVRPEELLRAPDMQDMRDDVSEAISVPSQPSERGSWDIFQDSLGRMYIGVRLVWLVVDEELRIGG